MVVFFSILWTDDHPQKDLAKFGGRLKQRQNFFQAPVRLMTFKNLCFKYGGFHFFFLKM
jgi:hypothetical protein